MPATTHYHSILQPDTTTLPLTHWRCARPPPRPPPSHCDARVAPSSVNCVGLTQLRCAVQVLVHACPRLVNATNARGNTPLHETAYEGRVANATALLRHGAQLEAVNARERGGLTPLLAAVQYGHTSLVKLLLRSRADTNTPPREAPTQAVGAQKPSPLEQLVRPCLRQSSVGLISCLCPDTAVQGTACCVPEFTLTRARTYLCCDGARVRCHTGRSSAGNEPRCKLRDPTESRCRDDASAPAHGTGQASCTRRDLSHTRAGAWVQRPHRRRSSSRLRYAAMTRVTVRALLVHTLFAGSAVCGIQLWPTSGCLRAARLADGVARFRSADPHSVDTPQHFPVRNLPASQAPSPYLPTVALSAPSQSLPPSHAWILPPLSRCLRCACHRVRTPGGVLSASQPVVDIPSHTATNGHRGDCAFLHRARSMCTS